MRRKRPVARACRGRGRARVALAQTSEQDARFDSAAWSEIRGVFEGIAETVQDAGIFLHSVAIRDMALALGRTLGLDERALRDLELGALFHDVGKIAIPRHILDKPGPLSGEERRIIETHPEVGEQLLEGLGHFDHIRRVVRSCHEHFDGSGYPDGLRGNEIPLAARIILVVDAYDAMTTDRAYQPARSHAEACARIERGCGRQFDPRVGTAFLEMLRADAA